MTHTHSPKSTREILGNELYECACGARKWSHSHPISGGILDAQGWYVPAEPQETPEEKARRHAIEMLETEGYGYDYHQPEPAEPFQKGDFGIEHIKYEVFVSNDSRQQVIAYYTDILEKDGYTYHDEYSGSETYEYAEIYYYTFIKGLNGAVIYVSQDGSALVDLL